MKVLRKLKRAIKSMLPDAVLSFVRMRNRVVTNATPPTLFNREGKPVKFIYLVALGSEQHPYSLTDGRIGKQIVFDRFNFGLNTHFYTSMSMFKPVGGGGKKRYGVLLEGEAIIPDVYERIRRNCHFIEENMVALFTHSKELLGTVSNARFCPAYSVWYGTEHWGGVIREVQPKNKTVSFVGCDKAIAPIHLFRQTLTRHFLTGGKVDVLGKAVGRFASCDEIFTPYRYNIAIENASYDYYFTEKILNCFAAKVVPIYYGCPGIGDFFNIDGIIVVKEPTTEAVEAALAICSEEDYLSRKDAINDNFQRVKEYLCVEDYLCRHYPDILQ